MGPGVEDQRDPQEEEHERDDGDDNGSECRSGHGRHLQKPLHRRGTAGTSPAQGDAGAQRMIAASIAASCSFKVRWGTTAETTDEQQP
jgi:hypothetical protein